MPDINKEDLPELEAEGVVEKSDTVQDTTPSPEPAPEVVKLPPHKEYSRRMASFNTLYIQTLSCSAVIVAIGVAVAVLYSVIIGLIAALCGAFMYQKLVSEDLKKRLGMRCKTVVGGLSLTSCRAIYGDVIWVPSTLMWNNLEDIGDRAFACEENATLTRIFLPASLKSIGADAFDGCSSLRDIYFEGDRESWEKLTSKTDLSPYRITFEAKYPPLPRKKKKVKTQKK